MVASLLALAPLGGCVGTEVAERLQASLERERSPDFSAEDAGHLDGTPTGLVILEDWALACSDEGLSLTALESDGDPGEEWLESDDSRGSDQALSCAHLDRWGDAVAMSAEDRVRLYKVYAEGDEPSSWDGTDQQGPLGWWMDIVDTDESWSAGSDAQRDWRSLSDARSVAFDDDLGQGFISLCCDRPEVLSTGEQAAAWDLVQVVPDGETSSDALILSTGVVADQTYLFGAGPDQLYAVALDGGPDLALPSLRGVLDGETPRVRALGDDLLWVGAGARSLVYRLDPEEDTWKLSVDSGNGTLFDAVKTGASAVSAYGYKEGKGVKRLEQVLDDDCLQGELDGHAYLVCETTLAFSDAKLACEGYGAFGLVEIGSEDENEWVQALADQQVAGPVWIGLSDADDEDTFRWISGAPLDYEAWEAGEPNNSGDEDCGQLYADSGNWNDALCDVQYAYMCESVN